MNILSQQEDGDGGQRGDEGGGRCQTLRTFQQNLPHSHTRQGQSLIGMLSCRCSGSGSNPNILKILFIKIKI